MKPLLKSQRNQLIKFVSENPDVEDIEDYMYENDFDLSFIAGFSEQYLSISELDKLSLDIAELIECVENEIQLNI
jgi:hypothetical protein